jgi:telomere length regulation protein
MRSGGYLSAVSNRLAASSDRARFLGMVVGEALSSLSDKGDKQMDFKMEDTKGTEGLWYKSLLQVEDRPGSLEPLKSGSSVAKTTLKPKSKPARPAKQVRTSTSSKIIAIEEVDDSDEDEKDGLRPYAKPDSDAEDSDEDPTLIQRNKPTAPVYIRDLITYLRNTESYDHQRLAVTTAPSLIRRKATFGTEVSSHAEELATLLVGLQDKYEIENFQDLRLQAMISLVVGQPTMMGPWFAKTFFDGDYSVSQRASVLTVLGLSARELGGFSSEDASVTKSKPSTQATSFPSKALPSKMHAMYAAPEPTPIDAVSAQLRQTLLQPLALDAADKMTGPNILKTRTFSSRLAVESKRKKPIPNALAKIVSTSFFFPLTGRFAIHLRAYGPTNVVFSPLLLTTFLKTLALTLHASGPSTLSLPQMTSEFLDLLLALRTASDDLTVIEALLFGALTILEMNGEGSGRSLAETQGRELLELQSWVESLFARIGTGSEEDEKVRGLAAGVLVRIREIVEKYQGLLVGDLAGFR